MPTYKTVFFLFLIGLSSKAHARFAAPAEVETRIMPLRPMQPINAYIPQPEPAFYESPLFISITVFTALVLALVLIIRRRNKTDDK